MTLHPRNKFEPSTIVECVVSVAALAHRCVCSSSDVLKNPKGIENVQSVGTYMCGYVSIGPSLVVFRLGVNLVLRLLQRHRTSPAFQI